MAAGHGRPRVGVSACLAGQAVRWDGRDKRSEPLLALGRWVELLPVCPEVEAGFGVPRPPIRLERRGDAVRVVDYGAGRDVTEALQAAVERRLEGLAALPLRGFVLKTRSPSCGPAGVDLWEGAQARPEAAGVFAAQLAARWPTLPVTDEVALARADGVEHFLTRVFAFARWRALVEGGLTAHGLVNFHARHKLLLSAHDGRAYRALGRLVAGAGAGALEALGPEYERTLMGALRTPPTVGRHVDAMEHLAGMVDDAAPAGEVRALREAIARYRAGEVARSAPLEALRGLVARFGTAWAREQAYLRPYPEAAGETAHPRGDGSGPSGRRGGDR